LVLPRDYQREERRGPRKTHLGGTGGEKQERKRVKHPAIMKKNLVKSTQMQNWKRNNKELKKVYQKVNFTNRRGEG